MSSIPTHIARYLKKHKNHKEGDLVLMPGELVESLVSEGVVSIMPEHVGDDFSNLTHYKP